MENPAILDIIVTHYNEPESVYRKFFDMLSLQRGVDFGDIHVIVVNDGEDNCISESFFEGRPYQVEQFAIPKAGISAVRNFGIDHAKAEWISFSDCDDMYTTVYSLKLVLDILTDKDKSTRFDMLWTKLCAEDSDGHGGLKMIMRDLNLVFIHGKYYRRSFIVNNEIRFPEELEFNEDSAFNGVANTYWDYRRTAEIKTAFPVYSWCYRPGSLTGTPENLDRAIYGSYQRNKIMCDTFEKRLPYDRFCGMVARTVFDTYYVLNVPNITPLRAQMLEDFRQWYTAHKQAFWDCDRTYMREIKAFSAKEHAAAIAEESIRWPGNPPNPCIESTSVTKWLRTLKERR